MLSGPAEVLWTWADSTSDSSLTAPGYLLDLSDHATKATKFVTNGELTGQDICYYTPAKRLKQVNPKHQPKGEINLKPGEERFSSTSTSCTSGIRADLIAWCRAYSNRLMINVIYGEQSKGGIIQSSGGPDRFYGHQ